MIGQHVSGTLWRCHYSYTRVQPKPDQQHIVTGQIIVMTADPTGGDLLEVVRRFVLTARPDVVECFQLTHADQLMHVQGLAQLVVPDRGWPAGLDVGAVVLEAGSRQMATIGDLRHELVLVKAERDRLQGELDAIRLARAREAQP
jgi:hypothetical protein